MGTAEGTIAGRPPFAWARGRARPRHVIAAFLRKIHIMKPEPTLEQRYKASMTKALECASSMDMKAALDHLDTAIRFCDNPSEALLVKAMVYMDIKKQELAAQAFRASMEALKVSGESRNSASGIFIEEYMIMRHNHPAPNVPSLSYIPLQNAFRDASIGVFREVDRNIGYALLYANGGLK